jgi:hypothetical protein
MQYILALRSYGDFVILLNHLVHSESKKSIKVLASLHLKPLYDALNDTIDFTDINIVFIDLHIQNGLLNLFSNQYIFSRSTITQIKYLKTAINQHINSDNYEIILEKEDRSWLLQFCTNLKFSYIVTKNSQVYNAFSSLFNIKNYLYNSTLSKGQLITILPIARLKKRNFPLDLVEKLVDKIEYAGFKTKVYSFKKRHYKNDFKYDSFSSLIQQIKNSNFIFCADSLQAHLSYLLKVPHFIYIPKHGKTDFLTPFVLHNNYFASFDHIDINFLDKQDVN